MEGPNCRLKSAPRCSRPGGAGVGGAGGHYQSQSLSVSSLGGYTYNTVDVLASQNSTRSQAIIAKSPLRIFHRLIFLINQNTSPN